MVGTAHPQGDVSNRLLRGTATPMPNTVVIGLISGFAAALMLFSAAQGPSFAGFLLSLTSMLPIFLAGLGWGLSAAAIAALTGAGVFAVIGSPAAGGIWLLSQAAPVLLLCYYAYLSRQRCVPATIDADNTPQVSNQTTTEWYPVGHLVAIAGVIGGALASISMLLLGTDIEAIRASIRKSLPAYIERFPQLTQKKIDAAGLDNIAQIAVYALPIATAIVCVMILLFNLWLAGRITKASGRLRRPWPDIAAMQIPSLIALALALSLFGTYLDGLPKLSATAFAGAFLFVYVCLGLAIIHYITRGNPYRGFILWAVYFALIFFNTYVLLLVALVGLTEPISPLKRQLPATPPKPPARPPPSDD